MLFENFKDSIVVLLDVPVGFPLGYSFFFFGLKSSVTEGEVLKTVSPYARDLETFLCL